MKRNNYFHTLSSVKTVVKHNAGKTDNLFYNTEIRNRLQVPLTRILDRPTTMDHCILCSFIKNDVCHITNNRIISNNGEFKRNAVFFYEQLTSLFRFEINQGALVIQYITQIVSCTQLGLNATHSRNGRVNENETANNNWYGFERLTRYHKSLLNRRFRLSSSTVGHSSIRPVPYAAVSSLAIHVYALRPTRTGDSTRAGEAYHGEYCCGRRASGGGRADRLPNGTQRRSAAVTGTTAAGQWRAAFLLSTVDMLFSNR